LQVQETLTLSRKRLDAAFRNQEDTMAIARWDPLGELTNLQDRINRAFSDYGRLPTGRNDEGLMTTGTWAPPVDIYQNENLELVLRAELPDMSADDIEISVNNDTLTIRGEKRFSNEVNEDQYHRIERRYGTFSRSFSLPSSVDATKISADQKNGVLTVRLPAREEAKPRQIKVDVRG
jgi:HSP20 family protein